MASVLAIIYEDILEFHQTALRVFKRPSKTTPRPPPASKSNTGLSMEAIIQICMERFQDSVSAHLG
jgi:hypothetical protein